MRRVLCLVFLLFTLFGYSQGIISKQYTIEDGLLANDIRALCVDNEGVLWVGSRSGLNQRVQSKIRVNEDADRFNYTNITSIIEDKNGRIWVGSYGQGVLYRGINHVQLLTTADGLVSDRVRRLYSTAEHIYVATAKGVSIISKADLSVVNPEYESRDSYLFEVSDFFSYKGDIYVCTINSGIYKIVDDKLVYVEKTGRVFASEASGDLVFLGGQDGLLIKNMATQEVVSTYQIPPVKALKIVNNQLYILSNGIDENNGRLYRWNGSSLEDLTVYLPESVNDLISLGYDQKNDFLYLGTKNQGVFQIDLFSPLEKDRSRGRVDVIKVFEDRLFLFTSKGLVIEEHHEEVKNISLDTFKQYQVNHYKKFLEITNQKNHFFEIDYSTPASKIEFYFAQLNQGTLWVSTNLGLFQLDIHGDILAYYSIHTYRFGFYKNHLIETNPYGGVRIYTNLDKLEYVYKFRSDSDDIPRDIVDVVNINDKMYFAGALDGLYTLEGDKFSSLYSKGIFTENRIKKLAVGNDNTLYVATDYNSVYILEIESGEYKIKDVIPSKSILGANISLLECVGDRVIIGTGQGLTIIEGDKKFHFNKEQGLGQEEILSYALKHNLLYLGGIHGLSTLDLDYFNKKDVSYAVHINDIYVNNDKLDKGGFSYYQNRILKLASDQKSIHISFEVLGPKFPSKLEFEYRLKIDEDWISTTDNSIDLHYLESGEYPIDLRIFDYDSGNEVIYPLVYLEVDKPFYLKGWFVALIVILSLVLFVSFYRFRVKQMRVSQIIEKKNLEYQRRLAEVKLQSVRSQMNSHFIFNVLSSIQYYIIKEEVDDALYYLERFADLIRTTLNISSKERITLKEECAYLKTYIEIKNMRLDGRIRFEIDFEDDCLQDVEVPPLLLQPFVENSLVHAFPKSIEHPLISISIVQTEDRSIVIEIKDNGVGDSAVSTKSHESKGMQIVKERMSLIQAYLEEDLTIVHHKGGTNVRLVLKNIV